MSKKSKRHNQDIQYLQDALYANGKAQLEGPQRKKWSVHDLKTIKPLTDSQEDLFHAWFNYDHVCAYGSAGTGKTFLAMFLALSTVTSSQTEQDRIIIVRSAVPTRDIGFLPGDMEEKLAVYETPYRDICADLVGRYSTYDDMKAAGIIEFVPTSFIRGLTWDNAVVIVDEGENLNFHEINSVMTRLGENSRMIFCGDVKQTDLKPSESGMAMFLKVVQGIKQFGTVEFNRYDIVRSDFVRSWIIACEELVA